MPIIWCSMPVVCWSCPEIGPSRLVIQQSLCRFHPVLRIDRPICLVRPDWDVAIQRTEMGCGNYGNPWKPMETHGNPWKPMETLICEGATKATNLQLKKVQNSWTTLAVAKTLVKFSCAWEKKWNNHRWQKKTTSNPSHGEFMRIQHQIASLLLNILLNWPKSRCHISIYIYISVILVVYPGLIVKYR